MYIMTIVPVFQEDVQGFAGGFTNQRFWPEN